MTDANDETAKDPDPLADPTIAQDPSRVQKLTSGKRNDAIEDALDEHRHRQTLGYWLMGGGAALILYVLYDAVSEADLSTPATTLELHWRIAKLVAHAAVAIALIYLGYAAIRAGERMLLPRWLLQDAKDVELVRALLGIDSPLKTVLKEVKDLLSGLIPGTKPSSGEK